MCSVDASTLYHSEGNEALAPGDANSIVYQCHHVVGLQSQGDCCSLLSVISFSQKPPIVLVIKLKIMAVMMAKCADELSPRFLLDRMMPVPTPYKITSRQGQCCVSKGILDKDNLATQGKQISSVKSADPTPYAYLCTCLRRT